MKYDDATSDNTSKYTASVNNASFTHDTSNNRYLVQKTTTGSSFNNSILVTGLSLDAPIELSVDAMVSTSLTSSYQSEVGLLIKDSNTQLYGGFYTVANDKKLTLANTPTSRVTNGTVGLAINTWYHIVFTITSSTVTVEIYNGETLVDSVTHSNSYLSSNMSVGLAIQLANQVSIYWKNLKVKPL